MTGVDAGPPSAPWHAGEVALHERLGVADRMAELGRRVIRDHMPDQHRAFFAQSPFLAVGAVDGAGDPWATILTGAPGFATSPDPRTLRIAARPADEEPATPGLVAGAAVGLLGIDLQTRRRNRMNGRVAACDAAGLTVTVDQSFGNCPQYIAARPVETVAASAGAVETLDGLDAAARALIAAADVLFVASYAETTQGRQVDVSHRGGKPGFVRVEDDGALAIPDFSGNRFFNTLGNIVATGRAGLAFIDPSSGDLLQLSGAAVIDLDPAAGARFHGAERLWRMRPRRILRRRGATGLRLGVGEAERSAMETGAWR